MPILKKGDKVGFIATSDGLSEDSLPNVEKLADFFKYFKLEVVIAKTIYKKDNYFSGTPKERADELMALFINKSISAIFDISGGDSCNQILPHLDFEVIKKNKKVFIGYSDISVLINSLYKLSGIQSVYYNAHNLYKENVYYQIKFFEYFFFENSNDNIFLKYNWLNKKSMSGIIIGGNIRCFLKLAGTRYFPNPKGKILLLEAYSGNLSRITSLLSQIEQIGYFEKISGIILGNFYEIEKNSEMNLLTKYLSEINQKYDLPIAQTEKIGHKNDSIGIVMGKKMYLRP
ncbi:MAG TPA: LD-carboxypeptidase [Spirochaetota bacterium]|nr:LD-carboxypeptidase [Spirochaetota bacterium]